MKLERTKNAARNSVFDGALETMNMLFPFVIRSVMLHYLGTEYLGLNGLFKSLLMFLNLAELGVGSAMVRRTDGNCWQSIIHAKKESGFLPMCL